MVLAAWSFCQGKALCVAGKGSMVTTSRSELWGAMWTFQDHGSTHEAVFGRGRPPGYRWLPRIQPSPVAAARSIWKTCFKDAGLAQAEPLPVARDLGDTSLMFLVQPTITPEQMAGYAEPVLADAFLGWLAWPLIALQGLQGPDGALNRDLIVVLDGGSARLQQAGRYRQKVLHEQPRTPPPPPSITGPPMLELLEGYDTVTQITALSGWLQRRQAPP